MNLSDVSEVEEQSEFTDHADSAGISTSGFSSVMEIMVRFIFKHFPLQDK